MKNGINTMRAFTLIELLIVVAIIAILAAIAVPNFLEAQTRANVSRTKSDIRTLVTATETYCVDHSNFPLASDSNGEQMTNAQTAPDEWFETKTPISITTPIAYITSRVGDVFAKKGTEDSRNFHYASISYLRLKQNGQVNGTLQSAFEEYYQDLKGQPPPSTVQYFYLSFGPDQDHDFDEEESEHIGEEHEHGHGAIYDSTNGTISSGDIHYMGPGIGFL